ncbi:transcriptional regulator [Agrobacterium vitis]|uniref:transcriptional regulator n=1 Tax=Rhizobium/Agrobacterium group TaxID=227290 RepID=UPI001321C9FA|nr:transcriptional regulator [Allorhizobium ampelinum]MVA46023.1 transcriptional regulator [Agrobacterium vitis]
MKKVQRSFVIEYKSGRQKPDPKSSSIWGTIDLKSVARDVEDDAVSFLPGGPTNGNSASELSVSKAAPAGPLLTPSAGQHKTTTATEETIMADENDTMTTTDAPAVAETPIAQKKQRQPRVKKASPQAGSVDDTVEPARTSAGSPEKQKRGRKAKSIEGAGTAKRAPVKRDPKAVPAAPVAPTAPALPTAAAEASDEMADLLQLEEENQRLRKLLAEKLRAENADLRKRLKLD